MTLSQTGESAARGRRLTSKVLLLAVLALSGLLALLIGMQAWIDVAFLPGVATVEQLTVTGQQASGTLTLVALAVLASVLVLTIAGLIFRRVLGVLIVLLGSGLVVIGIRALQVPAESARAQIEAVSGIGGAGQSELISAITVSAWPIVAAALGVVIALAGVCIVAVSGGWKSGGQKYEASGTGTTPKKNSDAEPDRISDWESLSDGDDPTEY